jgi:hypothetical protein
LFIGFARAERSLAKHMLSPLWIVQMAARTDTGAHWPADVSRSVTVFADVALKAEIFSRFPHLGINIVHAAILPYL